MPWFFEGDEHVEGLSSCFCGSLPPTSAYSIAFPLLQGVMWVTVGRNQELWKRCCKWTSPRPEWGHCDSDCRVSQPGPVGAVPVYTARNCSGIKLMSVERKSHCWHCIMSPHSPFDDFQNLNAHQGTAPKTRNGLHFAIGMNAIQPDL